MIIDVAFIYETGFLNVISDSANYNVKESANVTLSKAEGEDRYLIDSVGISEQDIKKEFWKADPHRHYRFTDPFALKSFDPVIAGNIVSFYCTKIRLLINPGWLQLRSLLRIDKFNLEVRIQGFSSLVYEQK